MNMTRWIAALALVVGLAVGALGDQALRQAARPDVRPTGPRYAWRDTQPGVLVLDTWTGEIRGGYEGQFFRATWDSSYTQLRSLK